MPSYFSLRERQDTDSDESLESTDSDSCYPVLQTCPRVGQQPQKALKAQEAAPKLAGINIREDYLSTERDFFRLNSVAPPRTPKHVTTKSSPPINPAPLVGKGPISSVKTPKPGRRKRSSLKRTGPVFWMMAPKPENRWPEPTSSIGTDPVQAVKISKPESPKPTPSMGQDRVHYLSTERDFFRLNSVAPPRTPKPVTTKSSPPINPAPLVGKGPISSVKTPKPGRRKRSSLKRTGPVFWMMAPKPENRWPEPTSSIGTGPVQAVKISKPDSPKPSPSMGSGPVQVFKIMNPATPKPSVPIGTGPAYIVKVPKPTTPSQGRSSLPLAKTHNPTSPFVVSGCAPLAKTVKAVLPKTATPKPATPSGSFSSVKTAKALPKTATPKPATSSGSFSSGKSVKDFFPKAATLKPATPSGSVSAVKAGTHIRPITATPKPATSLHGTSSAPLVKTPQAGTPKPAPPSGSVSSVKAGNHIRPITAAPKPATPLMGTSSAPLVNPPQAATPKPVTPLLGSGSVSLLKSKPTPLTPGPSTSKVADFPYTVSPDSAICTGAPSKAELLEAPMSPWSGGSSPNGIPEKVLPDWHALLFGGRENNCNEILTYPEMDTYFEDCKLAEDVALNFVSQYDMPVFDCLRDFHNFNKVSSALKNIPKKFISDKEQLLALLLMFDYLSCCCQEGNILQLYEKCMDKNKRYHLESLDQNIRLALDQLHSDRLRLDQLHSVDKLVKSCIERIPSSLKVAYFSVPSVLKRKLRVFEMDEKNKIENSVFNFSEVQANSPKKRKLSSVKSTLNKWELEDMDFSELMKTPTKGLVASSSGSPLSSSTPRLARPSPTPKAPLSSLAKRDLLSANSKDDWNKDRKVPISKPSTAQKTSKVTCWFSPENTPPKKSSAGMTSIFSMQRERSKEVFKSSKKTPGMLMLGKDDYSSDDSLPDIPDIVVPERTSSAYSSWRNKVLGNKAAENYTNDAKEIKHHTVKASTTPRKSPYKGSLNTWKSKYESPSKSKGFSPLRH